MSNVVLKADKVCKRYQDGNHELSVLNDINFELRQGERVAVMGSSGSGKSTLLNILSGLDSPTSGAIEVAGEDLFALTETKRAKLRNHELGFVYQFHHLLPEFTALENVLMPLLMRGCSVRAVRQQGLELLANVGLSERVSHKPGKLSGGERQRVAIARALVNKPACVLMDEPTGNLDHQTALHIQALMRRLNEEHGTAFLIVTHDHELANTLDRKFLLENGHLNLV